MSSWVGRTRFNCRAAGSPGSLRLHRMVGAVHDLAAVSGEERAAVVTDLGRNALYIAAVRVHHVEIQVTITRRVKTIFLPSREIVASASYPGVLNSARMSEPSGLARVRCRSRRAPRRTPGSCPAGAAGRRRRDASSCRGDAIAEPGRNTSTWFARSPFESRRTPVPSIFILRIDLVARRIGRLRVLEDQLLPPPRNTLRRFRPDRVSCRMLARRGSSAEAGNCVAAGVVDTCVLLHAAVRAMSV